jgi:hypothetical protein
MHSDSAVHVVPKEDLLSFACHAREALVDTHPQVQRFQYSQAVTHLGVKRAGNCLTSLIGTQVVLQAPCRLQAVK